MKIKFFLKNVNLELYGNFASWKSMSAADMKHKVNKDTTMLSLSTRRITREAVEPTTRRRMQNEEEKEQLCLPMLGLQLRTK